MDLLTYGRLGKQFADFANAITGIQCRFVEEEDISTYVQDYKAIAGFNLPEGINISHVRWIYAFSAGVDDWLKRRDLHPEVVITRTTGKMGIKMGEYCLNYLLHFLKNTGPALKNQHKQIWHPNKQQYLYDKEILILGTGSIGRGISAVLKPLAKKVVGINSSGKDVEGFDHVLSRDNLPRNLSQYYAVIDTLPHTFKTTGSCNLNFFKRFQKIIFMNVGRGATVNTNDLLIAMQEGYLKNAVLDVFEEEPLPEDSPLWNHPSVIITPHQSANTDIEDVKDSFSAAYTAFRNKVENPSVVDKLRQY